MKLTRHSEIITKNEKVLAVLETEISNAETYFDAINEIIEMETGLQTEKVFELFDLLFPRAAAKGIFPNFINSITHIRSLFYEVYRSNVETAAA